MADFESINLDFLHARAALKWGPWDRDVISLSVADIDFPAPREIKEAVINAVNEDRTPYSAYGGDPDVLDAVCEKLNRVNRIPATPDDVHMIPGTMFAIFLVCYHFLNQGDEALISPAPVYPPFIHNVLNTGAVPVFNPLDFQHGARLDVDDLKARITPRTRMLMVCNPHNPTGRVLTLEELECIARLADEHNLLIFADELYEDMLFEGEHISLASLSKEIYERTITVFGFSKAFGIPGYRIAYITTRSRYKKELKHRIHDMIVHADTLAQAAAKAALTDGKAWLGEFMSHLKRVRDYGLDRLSRTPGVWCREPEATPFLFPNIASFGMTSEEMCEYLREEAGVIVMNGAEFGPPGEGFIRINFATAHSVLKEAMDRMEAAFKRLA
ncbi:MAG: pyridoxal phosphate-dependent aminotransferase [Deltaproteobacteria bacterium]|nr:pyridoxal phosphate-dependent aminotransferase [Deltaproteobacteria bacterium]